MALFGSGMKPRTTPGVVPYYPTPYERATAIPGMSPARPAPRGMFGAQMALGSANPIGAAMNQAFAQAGDGGGLLAGAAEARPAPVSFDAQLPSPKLDLTSLATPVDLSNVQIKKPGFFQHGGLGEKLLKGFGEWGLRYSASQGDPYALMVMRYRFEQQQAPIRAQEEARRRQQEREEWMWREDYKRSHPDDQFTQYMQAAGIDPRSQQGQALYRQRAESMATPPMMAVDGFDAQGQSDEDLHAARRHRRDGQSGRAVRPGAWHREKRLPLQRRQSQRSEQLGSGRRCIAGWRCHLSLIPAPRPAR
ncbi:hypothetical protein [Sphingomonas adhaesiva]|uniref:hypothetical protein n=1 Tax=Sphingomonas adhaesiva TaxID=28212 RepID=UPI002FF4FEDF